VELRHLLLDDLGDAEHVAMAVGGVGQRRIDGQRFAGFVFAKNVVDVERMGERFDVLRFAKLPPTEANPARR